MTSYLAKFSDGDTISLKNSKREYAAAYRVIVEKEDGTLTRGVTGFSRNAAAADKAAASEGARMLRTTFRGGKFVPTPGRSIKSIEVVEVARS